MKKIRWFLLALLLLGAGLTGYAKGEAVSDQAGILTTRQEQSLEETVRWDPGGIPLRSGRCHGRILRAADPYSRSPTIITTARDMEWEKNAPAFFL